MIVREAINLNFHTSCSNTTNTNILPQFVTGVLHVNIRFKVRGSPFDKTELVSAAYPVRK